MIVETGYPWEPTGERLARWRKWGLEISPGAAAMGMRHCEFDDLSYDEIRDLPAVVKGWRYHELVSCWLENHPAEAAGYGDAGFGYFQVLVAAEKECVPARAEPRA